MITIQEAKSKKEITEFIKFPFSLYKDNKYWVPPLIADELETFDKTKNPAFENAEAYFFVAKRNEEIVGRIATIINWDEVNNQQKKKVRFGWFDVIDDIKATQALLEKVYELGRKNNLDYVEGPMGFSNLDKVGVLTEGFEEIGTMITWYNHPYYAQHFEQLGYVTEKEYVEDHLSAGDSAAIAMALHLYYSEVHDEESAVITIKTVERRYSPWSSKIYGLNNLVK